MSAMLDTLLGAERRSACARSDSARIRYSVMRNEPDLLVFDLKESVALEPQNAPTVTWLQQQVPDKVVAQKAWVTVERTTWPGLCRAALKQGIRLV